MQSETGPRLAFSSLSRVSRWWPAAVSLALLMFVLSRLVGAQLFFCDGHVIYALDDAYIHMATAKNLALHGVWGITRYQFSNSESSILWPCLLAGGFKLAGTQSVLPLILNTVAAVCLVVTGQVVFRREGVAPSTVLVGLIALVLLPAIPVMVIMGMEHVLHCVLTLWFAHLCVRQLIEPSSVPTWVLPVVGALMVSVRYEALFLVVVAALLLLFARNFRAALAIVACTVIPVVVFGVVSVSQGWQFLPNSLLVQSQVPDFGLLNLLRFKTGQAIGQLLQPRMLSMTALLVMALALVLRERRFATRGSLATVLALGTLVLHVALARTGSYYGRYEAYLFVLTVYAIVLVLGTGDTTVRVHTPSSVLVHVRSPWAAVGFALLVLCVPVLGISPNAYAVAPVASANIYSQQYQMGRFVSEYYSEDHVAVNDIGAVSYFSEVQVYDLWGLATNEVWKAKRAHEYDAEWMAEATRVAGVDVAIVYDQWFAQFGGLPEEWIHVGNWTIPSNVICGGDTVSFYAVDSSGVTQLSHSLSEFADTLPDSVRQSGMYLYGEE